MGMLREFIPTVFCEAFSGSGFGRRAVLPLARRRNCLPIVPDQASLDLLTLGLLGLCLE